MEQNFIEKEPVVPAPKKSPRRKIWTVVLVITGAVIALLGSAFAYGRTYEERVLPGVHVGEFDVGGMNKQELVSFIDRMHTKLLDEGINFSYEVGTSTLEFVVYPQFVGSEDVMRLIDINSEIAAQNLISYLKSGNAIADGLTAVAFRVVEPNVPLTGITYQKDRIVDLIEDKIRAHVSLPIDSGIRVKSVSPLRYEITSSSPGVSFEYDHVLGDIARFWNVLERPTLHIEPHTALPTIVESDVKAVISQLPLAFEGGTLTLAYTNSSTKREFSWKITPQRISELLGVEKNGDETKIVLAASSTASYFMTAVSPLITVEAQNAKFLVGENGKVSQFQGSHPGVTLDIPLTYKKLNDVFEARFTSSTKSVTVITLVTKEVEPKIKTEDVNNLGITEVLGVGHSVFRGSPSNRLKNIQFAAFEKLNGTLIKPGETFSLLVALKPFSIQAGYFPELVIKGDRVVPEVGGGLCQIGTTMFRAAMNSGLPIVERRNHSLWVSYYNDLSNGNPGTDATIYDSSPDFKFLNDTGHYILISSEMNKLTGDLYFTLWGTNDGRKGYYTPPKLLKRIPAGPTKYIETTELPPGKKECQHRYDGAVASFTYIRELPNGEKEEQLFTSEYRPLPETCLVGVEKVFVPEPVVPEELPPDFVTDG